MAPFSPSTDDQLPGELTPGKLHVIIGDDEDIFMFSAVRVFKRCGFPDDKIHQVETVDELCLKLKELQAGPILPVLCILNKQICGELARSKNVNRRPFVVCSSAMTRTKVANVQSCPAGSAAKIEWHYMIPKTFEEQIILDCIRSCGQWWHKIGKKNAEASAMHKAQSITMPELPGLNLSMSKTRQSSSGVISAAKFRSNLSSLAEPEAQPEAVESADSFTSRSLASTSSSNSDVVANALDSVNPAQQAPATNAYPGLARMKAPTSPFDDVKMVAWAGRGSFASVYKARWGISEVALKVTTAKAAKELDPLIFEGALSSMLSHPNLVQTYKYAKRDLKDRSEVWIVQEWCNMGTLHQRLRGTDTPLKLGGYFEVMEVALETASAAAYLHSRGVIHGDLSANNVLLCSKPCPKGYTCKVSDFGVSRVLSEDDASVKTASVGTISYMPPECFSLEANGLSKAVDVYSFGVILWQLCTDKVPFEGFKPAQVMVLLAQGTSLTLPENLPAGTLRTALRTSLAKDPAQRPCFDEVTKLLRRDFFQAQTYEDLETVDDLPELTTDECSYRSQP